MKKRMKKTISMITAVMIIVGSTVVTQAAGKDMGGKEFFPGYEGETLKFESTDNNPGIVPYANFSKGDLIYSKVTRSELFPTTYRYEAYYYSSTKVIKKFVKYLTGSWAYSDGYTWSKTNTTSVTGSGESTVEFAKQVAGKLGLSVSRSTSYSVAVSIPANKSKMSKLGFASDYTKYVYDYKQYKDTTLITSSRDTYYAPEKDTYLLVYYK